jgi:hypothetical protein
MKDCKPTIPDGDVLAFLVPGAQLAVGEGSDNALSYNPINNLNQQGGIAMRRILFIALLVILLLGITTSTVWAAPPAEEPSALDSLGEALGILGLFAAMMAILAAGTEIVVDTIKIPLGFKSKMTYQQALDNLEKLLPGKLEKLEVGAQAERQLTDTIAAMRELLQPVGEAQEFLSNLQEGKLKEATTQLLEWVDVTDDAKELTSNVADRVTDGLTGVVGQVAQALSLSSDVTQQATTALASIVKGAAAGISGQITPENAAEVLSEGVKFLQTQTPTLVVEWVRTQTGLLADQGVGKLMEAFEKQVKPQLKDLGLNDDQITQLGKNLQESLDQLEAGAMRDMDTYLNALRELLTQVEERRESTQSAVRKAWYWLLEKLGLRSRDESYQPKRERRVPPLKAETTAGWVMKRVDQQRDEEATRVRWLRFISVLVGIWLAYLLGINAANLLPAQLSALSEALNRSLGDYIRVPPTFPVLVWLNQFFNQLKLGMIVSGLAASAGSTFWHDQLDRLQVAKKVVGRVSEMTSQTQQSGAEE